MDWLSRLTKRWGNGASKPGRTRAETIANAPIYLKVGGCEKGSKSRAKTIELREPSIADSKKHFGLILEGISQVAAQHRDWLKKLWEQPEIWNSATDIEKFAPLLENLSELTALLVDETPEWVEEQMSIAQVSLLYDAYAEVIGYDKLRQVFGRALANWMEAIEKARAPKASGAISSLG